MADPIIVEIVGDAESLLASFDEIIGSAESATEAVSSFGASGEGLSVLDGILSSIQDLAEAVTAGFESLGGSLEAVSGNAEAASTSLEGIGEASGGIESITSSVNDAGAALDTLPARSDAARSSMLGGFGDIANSITNLGFKFFGIQAAFQGFQQLGNVFFGANAANEQLQVGLTTLMGSTKAANAELQALYQFAAKTPFQFPDLATDAKMMIAVGINAKQVIPDLTAMGDSISAVGGSAADMSSVVQIFDKIQTGGKLTSVEMMEMSKHMLPAWKILSEGSGKSIATLQEMTKKGLDAADAMNWLTKGMEKLYGGGMAKQAETFNGLMSTLVDNLNMAWRSITAPLFDVAKEGLMGLLSVVASSQFQQFAVMIGQGIGGGISLLSSAIGTITAPLVWMTQALGRQLVEAIRSIESVLEPLTGYLKNEFYDALERTSTWVLNTGGPIYTNLSLIVRDKVGAAYVSARGDALSFLDAVGKPLTSQATYASFAETISTNLGGAFLTAQKDALALTLTLSHDLGPILAKGLDLTSFFKMPSLNISTGGLGGLLGGLIAEAKRDLDGLIGWIQGTVVPAGQAIGRVLTAIFQPWVDTFRMVVHDLAPDFEQFGQWWQAVMNPTVDAAGKHTNALYDIYKNLIEGIGKFIEGVVRIGIVYAEVFGPILVTLGEVAGWLLQNKAVVDLLAGALVAMTAIRVSSWIGDMFNGVVGLIGKFQEWGKGIGQIINGDIPALKSSVEGINGPLRGLDGQIATTEYSFRDMGAAVSENVVPEIDAGAAEAEVSIAGIGDVAESTESRIIAALQENRDILRAMAGDAEEAGASMETALEGVDEQLSYTKLSWEELGQLCAQDVPAQVTAGAASIEGSLQAISTQAELTQIPLEALGTTMETTVADDVAAGATSAEASIAAIGPEAEATAATVETAAAGMGAALSAALGPLALLPIAITGAQWLGGVINSARSDTASKNADAAAQVYAKYASALKNTSQMSTKQVDDMKQHIEDDLDQLGAYSEEKGKRLADEWVSDAQRMNTDSVAQVHGMSQLIQTEIFTLKDQSILGIMQMNQGMQNLYTQYGPQMVSAVVGYNQQIDNAMSQLKSEGLDKVQGYTSQATQYLQGLGAAADQIMQTVDKNTTQYWNNIIGVVNQAQQTANNATFENNIETQAKKTDKKGGTAGHTLAVNADAESQTGGSGTTSVPGHASGILNNPIGHWALVGERGPEPMWVPPGASILPNSALSGGLMDQGGVTDRLDTLHMDMQQLIQVLSRGTQNQATTINAFTMAPNAQPTALQNYQQNNYYLGLAIENALRGAVNGW
ncbi:MAG TPA: tape measure protein [Ktedonobacteraceae bacterium]|nr:tape measure protein [Ktedonobacteraceae bacterium]